MPEKTVPRRPRRTFGRDSIRSLAGPVSLAALAGAFAWTAPERNAWAAAALAGALILDRIADMAGAFAARTGAPTPRIAGLPSLILPLRPGTGLGAALFASTLVLWPAGFPVMATALAGLVAMGAIARLALMRAVRVRPGEPEA